MRMWLDPRAVLIGCIVPAMLLSCVTASTVNEKQIKRVESGKLELIRLLNDQNFAALEARVANLQRSIAAGTQTPDAYAGIFNTFRRADPEISEPLKRWRETHPDSFAPHLAFGLYSAQLGWVMRGEEYIYLTNNNRLEQMEVFFDQAVVGLREALRIEPRLPEAWAMLIHIAKARDGHREVADIFKEGVRHLPRSSRLYGAYYDALSRKWVGSGAQRSSLKFRIKASFADDRDFDWIETADVKERAWDLLWGGQPAQARHLFDQVIQERPDANSHRGRGRALYRLGEFDAALKDLYRALALEPGKPRTYALIARVQNARKETRRAAQDSLTRALLFDPYNPRLLVRRARLFMDQVQSDEAKADLDKALLLGADDDQVRDARRAYFWSVEKFDLALREAERAVNLVPGRTENWYFYAHTLKRNLDCRGIAVFQRYLRVCRQRRECDMEQQRLVNLSIYNMKGGCD